MKQGVSLVALIITLVVIAVLTSTIAINGSNSIETAQLAVFYNNISTVQEAVQEQINNNLTEYAVKEATNLYKYKWVGVIEGYTEVSVKQGNDPLFNDAIIEGNSVKKLDLGVKKNLSISEEEFNKYYVDEKGLVYYYNNGQGFDGKDGKIYYNRNVISTTLEKPMNIVSEDSILSSIEITTPPTKIQYFENEKIDLFGMVITAKYSNGETVELTDGYSIRPGLIDSLTVRDTKIVITYTEKGITKTVNQPITVREKVLLSSLEITTPPVKTKYMENELLDLTDMIVVAKYTNGTIVLLSDIDYMVMPDVEIPLTASDKEIVISYTNNGITKTVSQPIEVEPILLSSLEITRPLEKTRYIENEYLDLTGLVITAKYTNNEVRIITSENYSTIPDITEKLDIDDTNVVISYTEKGITRTINQPIEVEEEVLLTSIEISESPVKKKYIEKEKIDLTGMIVTAKYTNGTARILTSDDYITVPDKTYLLEKEDEEINISYTERGITKTVSQSIEVEKKLLSSLSITVPPTKTQYLAKEKIDLTGMIVIARYSNGDTKLITNADYITTPLSTQQLKITDTDIVISYTENGITKTVKQNIDVQPDRILSSIELMSLPEKVVYMKNEYFDLTGATVLARYTNGTTEIVTDLDYLTTPLTLNDTNIAISYTEYGITKFVNQPIEVIGLTLGELIGNDATYYGMNVKYTAGISNNQVSDWKVFYKQTIDGEEYVYLITKNILEKKQIPSITGMIKGTIKDSIYWLIVPNVQDVNVAQKYFMANWKSGDTSKVGNNKYNTNNNAKCVSILLNTNLWNDFVNAGVYGEQYVIGAIGSPTAEMWVSSWNESGGKNLTLTESGEKGYKINNASYISGLSVNNNLYFPSERNNNYYYWLASPSSSSTSSLLRVYGAGSITNSRYTDISTGLHPVVCLKADIPAYWEDLNSRNAINLREI